MSLFPVKFSATAATDVENPAQNLPVAREVAWNFEQDRPIFRHGEPVMVEEGEAVKVWCYHALKVARGRLAIYSRDYGNELESLIGQPYTAAVKESEALRYVREALAPNPYVTGVSEATVEFVDGALVIRCKINTVYGEMEVKL